VSLSPALLRDALAELGARAAAEGKVIDLAIYGGSCLMLASNWRISTQDVDAVPATEPGLVARLASEVAAARGWPADWLNDGVRTWLSPLAEFPDHHALLGAWPSEAAPGLRVFVPTAEYLLAMKLMAMRIGPEQASKDLADLLALMRVVGIARRDDLVAFAEGFYPEARRSPRLLLGLEQLWRAFQEQQDGAENPPRYLGRGAPARNGR
jgi:hypothetical protein